MPTHIALPTQKIVLAIKTTLVGLVTAFALGTWWAATLTNDVGSLKSDMAVVKGAIISKSSLTVRGADDRNGTELVYRRP